MEATSGTILYVNARKNSPIHSAKLAGACRCAAARGWRIEAVPFGESRPGRIPTLLGERHPDGCLVECAGGQDFPRPALFGRIPAVYVDLPRGVKGASSLPTVSVDEEAVARAALHELSSGLPAAVAAVEHSGVYPWSRARAAAFRKLAVAAGLGCRVFASRPAEPAERRASRLARWLARLPRPCGVFAVNDAVGVDVVSGCAAAGLSIPRDVSLVGVDDIERLSNVAGRTFSSIRIDFERAGYMAAKLLGDFLAAGLGRKPGPAVPPPSISVGPMLVERRKSTSGRGRHEPAIAEAVAVIRREACEGLAPRALAARFPGSRRHFDARFREAVGHSVLDEIQHVRLERACDLLMNTDMPVTTVPDHCGFGSYQAADWLFRKRFGVSMRTWRRSNRR